MIGAGRMGRLHMRSVRELRMALVGVADQRPEALAVASEEHSLLPEQCFSDASALLNDAKPDCVIVATTAPAHCAYTCAAAELGARYILCEKPMAVSLAQCDRMIDACRANGAKLSVNHQMRFMDQYTEAKRIVRSAAFGGLSSITVAAGNFGMAMNGTHYFEMFRYMTDEPPGEATAWFSDGTVPNPRGAEFEDRAGAVRLTTPSGVRFYMEASADQGHGVKVIYSGHHGQLVVDELAGKMYLSVREEQHRSLPTTRYGMPWVESVQEIQPAESLDPSKAVLDALVNDRCSPSGYDGRLAVETLVASYVSDENGHKSVSIDGDLPRDRVFPWA